MTWLGMSTFQIRSFNLQNTWTELSVIKWLQLCLGNMGDQVSAPGFRHDSAQAAGALFASVLP